MVEEALERQPSQTEVEIIAEAEEEAVDLLQTHHKRFLASMPFTVLDVVGQVLCSQGSKRA